MNADDVSQPYSSIPETLDHQQRVGILIDTLAADLDNRAETHDASKMESPEVETFDEYTPKLRNSTYGSDEYKGFLASMGDGLAHHYAHNRHHPEHFDDGIDGMTLVDLIEMLADWKAAGERHANGSMARSLEVQQGRFEIGDQLQRILTNTAEHYGWL